MRTILKRNKGEMDKVIRTYASLMEMKTDEHRYRQPPYMSA